MQLQAKKSLGQHFLNSRHVLSQIIEAAKIQKGETVLEIGPGTGVLTEALLNAGAKIVAVEKDVRAVELLTSKFNADIVSGQLKIVSGDILDDALKLNLIGSDVYKNAVGKNDVQKFNNSYLIVANIPYYITGAILEKFLENDHKPSRMVLLVQKEVADRIVAKDGKESVLSVSVKAFGVPKIVAKVPPGAFTPPPTVDSAILAIENIQEHSFKQNNLEIPNFFRIVKSGFAHKRKFTIRNLEEVIEKTKLENVWNHLGLDLKIRSEKVSVEQWIEISKLCK